MSTRLGKNRPVVETNLGFLSGSIKPEQVSSDVMEIPLSAIDEVPTLRLRQPPYPNLDSLAQSIQEHGQTTPLFVLKRGKDRYGLISGYRRRAALLSIQKQQALVRVFETLSPEQAYALALSENADRDDLTDWERALACLKLSKERHSAEAIAKVFSWTDPRQARNHIRIAKEAPEPVARALQAQNIQATHALVMLKLSERSKREQKKFVELVIERGMSVREIQRALEPAPQRGTSKPTAKAQCVLIKESKNGALRFSGKLSNESSAQELDEAAAQLRDLLKKIRKLKNAASK